VSRGGVSSFTLFNMTLAHLQCELVGQGRSPSPSTLTKQAAQGSHLLRHGLPSAQALYDQARPSNARTGILPLLNGTSVLHATLCGPRSL
jgi:hypothetical protein